MTQNVNKLYGVVHDIELITPGLAAAYLETATINRRLSKASVAKYKRAMELGQWTLGQAICFDDFGRLIDGQHRLHAVIQSGIATRFNILRGLTDIVHMDIGRPRSAGDLLTMQGFKNGTTLAAVTRVVLAMEQYPNIKPVASGNSRDIITMDEILDRATSDSVLQDVSTKVCREYRQLGSMLKSSAAAAWFLYCLDKGMSDYSIAQDFLDELLGKKPARSDSPAFVLFSALTSKAAHRRDLQKEERVAYLIKAWNSYLEDKPISQLTYRRFGHRAESFPTMNVQFDIKATGVSE